MRRSRLRVGTRRRERVAAWVLLALALAAIGMVATVWRPLAPPVAASGGGLATFSDDVLATVAEYRLPRYIASGTGAVLALVVPASFVLTRWGRAKVATWAAGGGPAPLRASLVALRIAVATSLVLLPLSVFIGVVHEGRWGFRTRPVPGWFRDWFLQAAGRWLLVAVGVAVLMFAVRRWPRSWPARITVLGTLVVGAFVLLHPLVVQPLFLPTGPVPPGPPRDAIEEVLARAGADDIDLRLGEASLRTTRVNALVTGLGPTERVVVYDNLLELPPPQVAAVVAHELAHQEHADLLRGVALSATALLAASLVLAFVLTRPGVQAGVGARGPGDPRLAAVALLTLLVLEGVGTPLGNAVSRRAEAAADARAVALTRDPGTLVATTRIFTVRDLSPPTPPTWVRALYGTHPSVAERIAYLEGWAITEGIDLPDLTTLEEQEADQRHPAIDEEPPEEPGGARP